MYNLSEYIILSRSAYLLNKSSVMSLHEYNESEYDDLFNIDKNIESLFTSIYPGSMISKFILIRNEECESRRYFPIYLLEIPSFKDGKTLLLPMFLSYNGLLGIQTIFAYSSSLEEQPFMFDLFPIYPLKENQGSIDFLNYLKESNYEGSEIKEIEDKLNLYFDTTGYILNKIHNSFSNVSEFNIQPVALDSESSKYAKYIKNSYILDTPRENMVENMPIRPEMFMPLIIKEDPNSSTLKSSRNLAIFYQTMKTGSDNSMVTRSKIVPITKVEEIDNITTDTEENSYYPGKICIGVPDGCEYVIIDSTCMVYVGNGKLLSTIVDPNEEDKGSVNYIDLNKLILSEKEEITQAEESPYLNPLQNAASTESLASDMKNLVTKGKEVGMNFKSDMMPYLRKLIGLPKDLVQTVYKYMLRIFNKANDMEKNKALDYQEKLLNDEISEFSETLEKLLTNSVIGIAALMIPTSLIIQVIIFLIGKSINESIRLRAIERMEHRLEDIIDRLDKKIEFANQDYDKKAVNELKKQRSLYVFAYERIIKVKKKVYGKDRKASAFKDYENFKEEGK